MKSIVSRSLRCLLAASSMAIALPALCDDNEWFLRQMARTDGDANGDFYKPIPGNTRFLPLTLEEKRFIAEMQRSEGYVAESDEPKGEKAASR